MRATLGDGYVEALRGAWNDVPESADFVMFWWHHAAQLVAQGSLSRFGFITTNSLRQTFNRRVVQAALDDGLHLAFAIPDHPWVDSAGGAAVRIAMTIAAPGQGEGKLCTVTAEREGRGEGLEVELSERNGTIHADLNIGANVAGAQALRSNADLSSPGFKLHGAGFIVTPEEAACLERDAPTKHYRNGKDLADRPRGVKVIDLFGVDADEARRRWPATYQRVLERVKPERDHNHRASYRDKWWIFGEPRKDLRAALRGLSRYIVTGETAKHRMFQFLDAGIAPDNMLIAIALDDAYFLGILSSRVHVTWALAAGGTLEDRPRYNKSRCFETFPFPVATGEQQARIRVLAEQLDAQRKRVLAQYDDLTLTGLYNVLEKLRTNVPLNPKERSINDRGLVAVLESLHDELDAAVLAAYGWIDDPSAETLLERLVTLNSERLAEEASGTVRWLRPNFQNPTATTTPSTGVGRTGELGLEMPSIPVTVNSTSGKRPWPAKLPDQVAAIAHILSASASPQSLDSLAAHFSGRGKWKARLPQILETLVALGRVRQADVGWISD